MLQNRIPADKVAAFTQKIYTVFGIKVHFKDDPVYLEIGIRRTCLNRFVFYACALCVFLIILCDTQLKQRKECQYIPQIFTQDNIDRDAAHVKSFLWKIMTAVVLKILSCSKNSA